MAAVELVTLEPKKVCNFRRVTSAIFSPVVSHVGQDA